MRNGSRIKPTRQHIHNYCKPHAPEVVLRKISCWCQINCSGKWEERKESLFCSLQRQHWSYCDNVSSFITNNDLEEELVDIVFQDILIQVEATSWTIKCWWWKRRTTRSLKDTETTLIEEQHYIRLIFPV